MSEHPRHPGIPLSNTKIVPPYIPAPKKPWKNDVKTFTAEELASIKAETELLHSQFNKAIYDQTLAENARIKADNDRLKEAIADSYKAVDEMEQRFNALEAEFETHPMAAEIARLKAEVERLRKHGDAMAEALEAAGFNNARDFWNAAKEGKGQP
jgi:predicted RNase H-like nuclease (RuvC/YqgF family)